MAVRAPAIAHQCGLTFSPASKPNSTMMGNAATSVDSHQCPSGSYTWVQVIALSFIASRAAKSGGALFFLQAGLNSPLMMISSLINLAWRLAGKTFERYSGTVLA